MNFYLQWLFPLHLPVAFLDCNPPKRKCYIFSFSFLSKYLMDEWMQTCISFEDRIIFVFIIGRYLVEAWTMEYLAPKYVIDCVVLGDEEVWTEIPTELLTSYARQMMSFRFICPFTFHLTDFLLYESPDPHISSYLHIITWVFLSAPTISYRWSCIETVLWIECRCILSPNGGVEDLIPQCDYI